MNKAIRRPIDAVVMRFFSSPKTANGVKIIPGLRVRIITPGHECESNVANPAFDGSMVLINMHRGKKMVHPNELEAV